MDVLPVFDVAAWSAFAIARRRNAAISRHGSALYLGAPTIRGMSRLIVRRESRLASTERDRLRFRTAEG